VNSVLFRITQHKQRCRTCWQSMEITKNEVSFTGDTGWLWPLKYIYCRNSKYLPKGFSVADAGKMEHLYVIRIVNIWFLQSSL
jgi:hypothetical protein